MKISIITACFNSERTIAGAIESVLSQDYRDVEYIVVDGKSSDRTLSVVEKYRSRITRVISEKDHGIYDALNKGIGLATGEVIGFLHSDDYYAHPGILSSVAAEFVSGNADSVYGDLQYVDKENPQRVIRHWKSGAYHKNIFLSGWMPPHPSFFLKRECYERFGTFNTSLKSAADYELMLRMLHKHGISTAYLPKVLVKMRVGGQSNASLINRIRANREDRKAWEINGLKPGLLTLWLKPLSKIKQYFYTGARGQR